MSVSLKSSINLVLIGYRSSGKTTVGRLLAHRLGWTFLDTDEQVTANAGMTIKAIFEQHGEFHFRQLENQALSQVSALRNHVISLGGGAILAESNQSLIRAAMSAVIYLRADPQELWRRIQADRTTAAMRPNLTSLAGGIDEIHVLLAQREPIYRGLATTEIDVSSKTPEGVADAVLQMMVDAASAPTAPDAGV